MAILNFGMILLLCFSNLEYSFGKPNFRINTKNPESLNPEFKTAPIDSEIKKENNPEVDTGRSVICEEEDINSEILEKLDEIQINSRTDFEKGLEDEIRKLTVVCNLSFNILIALIVFGIVRILMLCCICCKQWKPDFHSTVRFWIFF